MIGLSQSRSRNDVAVCHVLVISQKVPHILEGPRAQLEEKYDDLRLTWRQRLLMPDFAHVRSSAKLCSSSLCDARCHQQNHDQAGANERGSNETNDKYRPPGCGKLAAYNVVLGLEIAMEAEQKNQDCCGRKLLAPDCKTTKRTNGLTDA